MKTDQIKYDDLSLPIQEESFYNDPYGAKNVLAKYCGYNNNLPFINDFNWQHGWCPDYTFTHPILAAWAPYKKGTHCFVSKKFDEKYLHSFNYDTAIAIGLAVCYVPDNFFPRIPNSLLVMPVHSVDFTTHESWKFKDYVNDIMKIADQFDRIVVCVHPSCFKKGYWVNEFKSAGFEVIEGIDGTKTNALIKLQALMSSFEYVTTNGFGSHLSYAAYWGAKPSIYGTYAEYSVADLSADPFYDDYPNELVSIVNSLSKKVLYENYPQLFINPKEAKLEENWGKYEVGFDCKKSPKEIKKLLGWTLFGWLKFLFSINGLIYMFSTITPVFIKKIYRTSYLG